jgi:predicted alpha/beta-fold hydrolase
MTKGDAQTIGAFLWPARLRLRDETQDEERLFDVAPDTKVLARCRWQRDRFGHPTLVMWHGMEGSAASAYMLTTAAKAFRAGFNVVRMNYRNCGGTENLTPTLYHGGLTQDLRAVLDELIHEDRLTRIVIAGFSLGGNQVLKLAGEYGDQLPPELKGLCAVSPSIDLRAGCDLLMQPRNWLYQRDFLYYLKRKIKAKQKLFPDLYDTTGLRSIRTLEQYDARYVAPNFGFADVNDYYAKASALPLMSRIRLPSLIIHAADDPFIPVSPLRDPAVTGNPSLLLVITDRGGHVAFVSAETQAEDRFWAENRLVDFCTLVAS